ncbi:hypothetical protein BT69DRAFT_1281216, partial [Atractiella rhizophila]
LHPQQQPLPQFQYREHRHQQRLHQREYLQYRQYRTRSDLLLHEIPRSDSMEEGGRRWR